MKQSMPLSSASGSISQNIVQFEMEKSALKCNLNKMMITKVKRANNGKPMTDQKYVLSFQANFQLDDTHFDVRQFFFASNLNNHVKKQILFAKIHSPNLDLAVVVANCGCGVRVSGASSLGQYHLG